MIWEWKRFKNEKKDEMKWKKWKMRKEKKNEMKWKKMKDEMKSYADFLLYAGLKLFNCIICN